MAQANRSVWRAQPGGQIAAVRTAGDRHPVRVDEASFDQLVGGGEDVPGRLVSPLPVDGGGEVLTPRSRSVEVDHGYHVSGGGERMSVPTEMEEVTEDAMRPAVDLVD